MFWQEETDRKSFQVPDDVFDLHFSIQCRELPVDHAYPLFSALVKALPWLENDEQVGVHEIHMAGSQNGWERPNPESGQRLILSRRTKLVIRSPKARLQQIQDELLDIKLNIEDCEMIIGTAKLQPLSTLGTLYARHVVQEEHEAEDETRFLQRIITELKEHGTVVRKAMCGKQAQIGTPDGPVMTRSVMLADLAPEESVDVQQSGLGPHRHLGCGLFLPMKGIQALPEQ